MSVKYQMEFSDIFSRYFPTAVVREKLFEKKRMSVKQRVEFSDISH